MANIDYSILICTYNPDERLLQRCLNAVLLLQHEGISREIILVDNNSTVPLETLPYVRACMEREPAMKVINVKEQGLTHARMGGIEAAGGKYIVFFDDDNEPDSGYLQELKKLHTAYPQVGAWGPGNIWVDFIDGVDPKLESFARQIFQERHNEQTVFDNAAAWQDAYPYGTGLCMRADILNDFAAAIKQGQFTLTDRKGNSLSSGGDTQMVLFCIRSGAYAGVSPALKLQHMTPGKKANPLYMRRLVFGTGVCYATCMVEVFPSFRSKVEADCISPAKFTRKTFKKVLKMVFSTSPLKKYDLVYYLASVCGNYHALNKPWPAFVQSVLRALRVI